MYAWNDSVRRSLDTFHSETSTSENYSKNNVQMSLKIVLKAYGK